MLKESIGRYMDSIKKLAMQTFSPEALGSLLLDEFFNINQLQLLIHAQQQRIYKVMEHKEQQRKASLVGNSSPVDF